MYITHPGKLASHPLYMGTHGIIDGDEISSVYGVKMVKRRIFHLTFINNCL